VQTAEHREIIFEYPLSDTPYFAASPALLFPVCYIPGIVPGQVFFQDLPGKMHDHEVNRFLILPVSGTPSGIQ
jgi:hypothetical protein